jgi:DNA polymerase-1
MVTGNTEITEQERQFWKVTYLSLLYGGGVKTIQLQFNNTPAEAKQIIKTFHKNWPAVRALQDRVIAAHHKRGYILGIDGRHLHMEEHGEHKLLNKLIQGSAAGLIKQAIRNVHQWTRTHQVRTASVAGIHRPESRMVSVVHDELIFDGPTDELEILNVHIPPLMVVREDIHAVVPILVDHEVSTTSWADKISFDEWRSAVGEGQDDSKGQLQAHAV